MGARTHACRYLSINTPQKTTNIGYDSLSTKLAYWMLKTLKDLFDKLTESAGTQTPDELAHHLKLASAVLLVHVMQADEKLKRAKKLLCYRR